MKGEPAAEYVRMSTEEQEHSIENQKRAIREFACKRGFRIVRTYEDAGKSGVTFSTRPGLRNLLQDVISHCLPVKAVLVYDISRWGRFQDCDEAAHYEFICRANGIAVLYCAEPFENNTTSASMLIKAVKRTMAAEFSRQLGEQVFQRKKLLVEQGLRVGGAAPLGLRRAAVSQVGTVEQVLEFGMHNGSSGRRIVMVPGPREEVRLVRRIFHMLVDERKSCIEIARELNRLGYINRVRPWNATTIQNVLTNPIYEGSNVWGRTSQKMRGPSTRVQSNAWIVKPRAFPAITRPSVFRRAQAELRRRGEARLWPDEKIIQAAASLLRRRGTLSIALMEKTDRMPSSRTVRAHFGSYRNLYRAVRYHCDQIHSKRADAAKKTRTTRAAFVRQIVEKFKPHVRAEERNGRCALVVDDKTTVVVYFCPPIRLPSGLVRWNLRPRASEGSNHLLICLLDRTCAEVAHMRLFCSYLPSNRHLVRIGLGKPWFQAGISVNSIDELYSAIKNLP